MCKLTIVAKDARISEIERRIRDGVITQIPIRVIYESANVVKHDSRGKVPKLEAVWGSYVDTPIGRLVLQECAYAVMHPDHVVDRGGFLIDIPQDITKE